MHVPDLTPHPDHPDLLAVGWLEPGQPFTRAACPPEFLIKLLEVTRELSVDGFRGFHRSTLLPESTKNEWGRHGAPFRGGTILLGDAEILVDRFYAPNMVCLYCMHCNYQPPAEFIDAVMKLDIATARKELDHRRWHRRIRHWLRGTYPKHTLLPPLPIIKPHA